MAKRTTERGSIEVGAAVKEQLVDYQGALHKEIGRRATQAEIIGALLSGVPLWQVNAMLDAYRPQLEPSIDTGSGED